MLLLVATAALAPSASGQEIRELKPVAALQGASFTRIRGLHALGDGRVLVTDQTEKAVWIVDLERGTRVKVGNEGPGPEEYASPIQLMPFRGDSIVLEDLGNGRLTFYSRDLEVGRSIPMFAVGGTLPGGADTVGNFYVDRVTTVRIARRRDPTASDRAPLERIAEARPSVSDTVTYLTVAGPINPQPWYPWDAWAVGADGRVLVVRNQDEYRVEWYVPGARPVVGGVVPDERPAVRAEDRRLWAEAHPSGAAGGSVRMGDQPAQRPPAADFPDRFPYANSRDVWVDAEGRGWVGRYQPQRETRPLYDVFDGQGRRMARIRLPAGRQVIGFGPHSLYAVRVDEVDLQWLERYDIGDIR